MTTTDKTTELLMAARKCTTASWGATQYVECFKALGWAVEVAKVGRKVNSVTFTSPAGQKFVQNDDPRYKQIIFYDFGRFLKQINYNMATEASRVLGLPTLEEERATKRLAARDFTNTGTCGVCGANVKRAANGGLVHHGFLRPGDGHIYGDCYGVGYQPWELSPQAGKDFLANVIEREIQAATNQLAAYQAPDLAELVVDDRTRPTRFGYAQKTITREHGDFAFQLDLKIDKVTSKLRCLTHDRESLRERIAKWAPGKLPG